MCRDRGSFPSPIVLGTFAYAINKGIIKWTARKYKVKWELVEQKSNLMKRKHYSVGYGRATYIISQSRFGPQTSNRKCRIIISSVQRCLQWKPLYCTGAVALSCICIFSVPLTTLTCGMTANYNLTKSRLFTTQVWKKKKKLGWGREWKDIPGPVGIGVRQ